MSGKAVKNSPSSAADSSDSPGSVSFSSVYDVVPESAGSSLATATKLSLVALKDILEAVDSLPCVKYIAGVGIKILDITDVSPTVVLVVIFGLSKMYRRCRVTRRLCATSACERVTLFLLLLARANKQKPIWL